MKTLRPLYVDHTAKLGGAELSLLDLAAHRPGAGVAVFESGPLLERLAQRGVPGHVIDGGSLGTVRRSTGWLSGLRSLRELKSVARQLADLAVSSQADIFYANSLKGMFVAAWAGRMARLPVAWHLRDMLTAEHFSRTNRRVCVGVSNRWVTHVIANSHATAQAYADAGGRTATTVIYNGIDPEAIDQAPPPEDVPATGRPVVGVFSRLSPWKGQHVLLEALAAVPSAEAWIVGDALFGEADYAESLHQQVKRLGLDDRVRFLGFRDDVPGLLKRCDVVVHTSTSPEPFGRVIVEAMLAGRPVIATAAGGALELIEEQETGILIKPGDPAALAAALSRCLGDPDRTRDLAQRGQRAALEKFDLKMILAQWDKLITADTLFSKGSRSSTTPDVVGTPPTPGAFHT